MIELRLERERFGPAETVNAAVAAQAHVECRQINVMVSFRERTADFEEPVRVAAGGRLHAGPLTAGTVLPFTLPLPPDPLPPYRSRWGELFWEVEARADMAIAVDVRARRRIVVIPPGIEEWQLAGEGSETFERRLPDQLAEWAGAPGIFGEQPRYAPGPEAPPPTYPPGWHPDPWGQKRLRWWDGRTWTSRTAD